jgi:hypothetical protein
MPCRVSSDVHEWINDPPAVPAWGLVNPHNLDEQSRIFQRGEKSPWSFTATCRWIVIAGTERRWEPLRSTSSGVDGGANVTPPICDYSSNWTKSPRQRQAGSSAGAAPP